MHRFGRILSFTGLALAGLAITVFAAWAAMALWFRLPGPRWLAGLAAAAMAAACLASLALLFTPRRGLAVAAFAVLAVGVIAWWSTIRPPAAADFAPDVARQVTGVVAGDRLTLRDVRAFAWRTESDATERWEERTYDLATLSSLDLFLSDWGAAGIVHMIMSFGFDDGRHIAWSVEVRRLRGAEYSPVADMFKTNPLVIIAADEQDVIGVRANIRGENVTRYRLNLRPETIRKTLLEYVDQANALARAPRFYNSLTTNCTTAVVAMMRAVGATLPLDWRLVVNSRLPDYAYAHGALEPGLTLEQAKAKAPVSARAKAHGLGEGFSAAIRR